MRALKVLAVIFISLMLVISILIWHMGSLTASTLLYSNYYTRVFESSGIYKSLYENGPDLLLETRLKELPPAHRRELVNAAKQGISEEWLKQTAEFIITSTLDYVKGNTDSFSIPISLNNIRNAILNINLAGLSPVEKEITQKNLAVLVGNIPESADAAALFKNMNISLIREKIDTFYLVFYIVTGAVLVFILMLFLLCGRRVYSLRLPGFLLLIPGLLFAVLSFAGPGLAIPEVNSMIANMPDELAALGISKLVEISVSQLFLRLATISLAVTGLGLLLVMLSYFFRYKKKTADLSSNGTAI